MKFILCAPPTGSALGWAWRKRRWRMACGYGAGDGKRAWRRRQGALFISHSSHQILLMLLLSTSHTAPLFYTCLSAISYHCLMATAHFYTHTFATCTATSLVVLLLSHLMYVSLASLYFLFLSAILLCFVCCTMRVHSFSYSVSFLQLKTVILSSWLANYRKISAERKGVSDGENGERNSPQSLWRRS